MKPLMEQMNLVCMLILWIRNIFNAQLTMMAEGYKGKLTARPCVLFRLNSLNVSSIRGNPMDSDVLALTRPLVDTAFNPPDVVHEAPDERLVYDQR